MKVQPVRLIDVFVLGPFLIWAGINGRSLPMWARDGLVISGALTSIFNGLNWLEIEREESQNAIR